MKTYCNKCILPGDYPGISFNEHGICNFCLSYKRSGQTLGKDKLNTLINLSDNKGGYDCVIPLSGGKDSTYILYYAVKELNLKAIAVNYDSGFQSELSRNNMKLACEILEVPLVIKSTRFDIKKQAIKEALLMSETIGIFVSICSNCEVLLRAVTLNIAREYNVPFIMWGSSSWESETAKDYEEFRSDNRGFLKQIGKIKHKYVNLKLTPSKIIKVMPHLIKHDLLCIYEKLLMRVPLKYAIRPKGTMPFSTSNPLVIHFFDYIDYNPSAVTTLLKSTLQWKHPENRVIRFDCLLSCFVNHRSLQTKRISACGTIYCNLIRENKMARKDALVKEEMMKGRVTQECKNVIEGLGLDKDKMPTARN